MKDIETGAVHFFFNFDKIIRNKKLAIFQHSLKDLDLLVISIYNKNWCLILYKTKTSKYRLDQYHVFYDQIQKQVMCVQHNALESGQ